MIAFIFPPIFLSVTTSTLSGSIPTACYLSAPQIASTISTPSSFKKTGVECLFQCTRSTTSSLVPLMLSCRWFLSHHPTNILIGLWNVEGEQERRQYSSLSLTGTACHHVWLAAVQPDILRPVREVVCYPCQVQVHLHHQFKVELSQKYKNTLYTYKKMSSRCLWGLLSPIIVSENLANIQVVCDGVIWRRF